MRDSLKVGAVAGVVLVGTAALSLLTSKNKPSATPQIVCSCMMGHRFTLEEAKALSFAHHHNRIYCMEKK